MGIFVNLLQNEMVSFSREEKEQVDHGEPTSGGEGCGCGCGFIRQKIFVFFKKAIDKIRKIEKLERN